MAASNRLPRVLLATGVACFSILIATSALLSIGKPAAWAAGPASVGGTISADRGMADTGVSLSAVPASVSSGDVYAWGMNAYNALGTGGPPLVDSDSRVPVPSSGLTGVIAVTGGGTFSLALKRDGTVWSWGYGSSGQLGNGQFNTLSTTPVQISGFTGATAIAAGWGFALALKSDGTVWAWGNNAKGQLGNGTTANSFVPVQVSGLTGVTAIGAGYVHGLAIKSDGTVWAWGQNDKGQLGNGTTTDSTTPVQVSGLAGATSVAGGGYHSLAIKSDGTVWAWGWNGDMWGYGGQLGNGTTTDSSVPVQVSGLSGAVSVAGGDDHSLAVKSDGTVWAWGSNNKGALGIGSYLTPNRTSPAQVSGLTGATSVAAGEPSAWR